MRRILSASVALVAIANVAHAQQSPPPVAGETEAATQEDEIVVLAPPGDQVRIDRRTYTLRDDPAAQTANMFDVLGRVPSVSVAPSGAVTLLGAGDVTIQINGQTVPGNNLEQVLRGLTGAEVERIEVITNPSAQYSAQASGGIINIITRQRFNAGFSGSVQAAADTLNTYHLGASPSLTQGPWTFSGGFGFFRGEQNSDFEREIFAASATTREEGRQDIGYGGFYANRLQAGYQFNQRRRANISLDGVSVYNDILRDTQTSDSGGPLSAQTTDGRNEFDNRQLNFELQQTGALPREQVRLTGMLQNIDFVADQTISVMPSAAPLSLFATRNTQQAFNSNMRLDVERPLPNEAFLTLGAALDAADQEHGNTRQTLAGTPAVPDYQSVLESRQQTVAAYATLQFTTGDWTWQPGVRGENYRREVVSASVESDTSDLRYFPSLHIRRSIGSAFELDLSYTSRIARPGLTQLDPGLRFLDVNRAIAGNPSLQPSTTGAYEANLTYQRNGANIGITLYNRIAEDIVSPFVEVRPDGTIVTSFVNAGTSEQRGLQAILRGPLGKRWRYSLTANLLNREFDVLSAGATTRRSEFEYDGVAQIDYRDRDQNAIGSNQLQFELRFQGPRHTLQSDFDEFVVANFTWRRRLSRSIFGVFSVNDILSSQNQIQEITTADYFERAETSSPGTRVRVALAYQFGTARERPPTDQPPPVPIPG